MRCLRLIVVLFVFYSSVVQAINVSVTTQLFYTQEEAYLEVYSRVISESVLYQPSLLDSTLQQSSIELLVIIKENDSVRIAEKYQIDSPASIERSDFWDLKKYGLMTGEYSIELLYRDLYNATDTLVYQELISVKSSDEYLLASDVLLMSDVSPTAGKYNYEKSGFYYEPLCYDLVGKNMERLIMYLELKNCETILKEEFYVKYYPIDIDDTELENEYTAGYKKLKPNNDLSILLEYNTTKLPSGNYEMVIEVHKKDKSKVSQISKTFSVHHPLVDFKLKYRADETFETSFVQFLDTEALDYSLKAVFPRVPNNMTEVLNQIIASKDLVTKRYFLYNYWISFSADNPKAMYEKYMEVAKAIDRRYINNVGHGFESDRGYYFLKYGRPDNIVSVEEEPSAPPYEIWIYNYLPETQQTNVKFLFYNPSLVTNDYQLLHSTCRGERNNPRWEVDLYSDDFQGQNNNYHDARTTQDNFNRNARRYFSDL